MEVITKDDGTEVTVYSQEELEVQKQEAIEEYKTANPDKSDELQKLQDDIKSKEEESAKLQDELTGLRSKDTNFKILKGSLDKKDKEIVELKTFMEEKIGTVKKEILEGVMKEHYTAELERYSQGDEELKKKIELKYNKDLSSVVGSTKEEISNKVRDASILASPESYVGVNVFSSGGVGKLNVKSTPPFTAEERELLNKMASAGGIKITDEDLKKQPRYVSE